MDDDFLLSMLILTISGAAAYQAYQNQGIFSASAIFIIVGWLIFNFRNESKFLNSTKTIFNPLKLGIVVIFLGFAYYAIDGFSFQNSILFSVSLFFFGILFSMLVYKYWNIGSH